MATAINSGCDSVILPVNMRHLQQKAQNAKHYGERNFDDTSDDYEREDDPEKNRNRKQKSESHVVTYANSHAS